MPTIRSSDLVPIPTPTLATPTIPLARRVCVGCGNRMRQTSGFDCRECGSFVGSCCDRSEARVFPMSGPATSLCRPCADALEGGLEADYDDDPEEDDYAVTSDRYDGRDTNGGCNCSDCVQRRLESHARRNDIYRQTTANETAGQGGFSDSFSTYLDTLREASQAARRGPSRRP